MNPQKSDAEQAAEIQAHAQVKASENQKEGQIKAAIIAALGSIIVAILGFLFKDKLPNTQQCQSPEIKGAEFVDKGSQETVRLEVGGSGRFTWTPKKGKIFIFGNPSEQTAKPLNSSTVIYQAPVDSDDDEIMVSFDNGKTAQSYCRTVKLTEPSSPTPPQVTLSTLPNTNPNPIAPAPVTPPLAIVSDPDALQFVRQFFDLVNSGDKDKILKVFDDFLSDNYKCGKTRESGSVGKGTYVSHYTKQGRGLSYDADTLQVLPSNGNDTLIQGNFYDVYPDGNRTLSWNYIHLVRDAQNQPFPFRLECFSRQPDKCPQGPRDKINYDRCGSSAAVNTIPQAIVMPPP